MSVFKKNKQQETCGLKNSCWIPGKRFIFHEKKGRMEKETTKNLKNISAMTDL